MGQGDTRKRLVERLGRRLRRTDWPRFEMSLMMAGTGAVGFVASFLLLHAGLGVMWLRYTLSVALAYAAFLGLLRFWMWRHCRRSARSGRGSSLDLGGDIGLGMPGGGGSGSAGPFRGGGGRFSGGGASGSLDGMQAAVMPRTVEARAPAGGGGKSGFFSGFNSDCDLDELVVLIALIAAVAGALIASLWIIISAPTLLAELLLDGLLVSGLHRRMRKVEREYWLHSAFDRTVIPFAVVAVLFGLLGWALQNYAPEARSIGDAWLQYRVRHPG